MTFLDGRDRCFGAISGSGPATVAAVERLMYKPLLANGYSGSMSAGPVVTSGGIAALIPPSLALILYDGSAEQAVNLLFLAGVLPGLVLAILMAVAVYAIAARDGIGSTLPFHRQEFMRASRDGVWALVMPVIILGGIYTGVFSRTEPGGVACVWAMLVTVYIYKSLIWADVWEVAADSKYLTAQFIIIVAAAGVYSWILTVSGSPQAMFDMLLKDIYRGLVPFFFINIVALVIVTYWADLSLALVRLLG